MILFTLVNLCDYYIFLYVIKIFWFLDFVFQKAGVMSIIITFNRTKGSFVHKNNSI